MHTHQLFDHPYFEERPVKDILEPFGFEVHFNTHELPIDALDTDEDCSLYSTDPSAYIEQLESTAPPGYTEIYRSENEDGILIVSVLPKTLFAQLLLCADRDYANGCQLHKSPFSAIYEERMRQLSAEGFSREHDDLYNNGELALAASAYAISATPADCMGEDDDLVDTMEYIWPWEPKWLKPSTPRRDLVKAGALILAEIERIDRAAEKAAASGGDA
ncbi:hypothetical protein [Vreelandella alkaliphila]|uniref:Uncharacterized protein n=1 Tax=Vreelandella alkaliphila TaxID=272774 RepID=A0A7C9P3U8_9GAMM|nr:hypothetical protein [Halomonas alkaliphila]NDL70536.1 hypothetical protein [Halomonas alkaliphila]